MTRRGSRRLGREGLAEVADRAVWMDLAGGPELLAWFGQVPRFHDGEVVSLALNRTGASRQVLRGWVPGQGTDEVGFVRVEKRALVVLELHGISDLQLEGFNHQNVIDRLQLRKIGEDGQDEVEITLDPCWGLSGFLRAKGVSVRFTPRAE